MANPAKRVSDNVPGDYFVDSTCIDCDTCRQIAPSTFAEGYGHAFVHRQPQSAADRRTALHALVSCPTGSIGTIGADDPRSVMADFPLPIEGNVFYCGFNSQKSFGGNSWFVQHPQGNWLIDSPKFLPQLVRKFESLGGIARIFLTHRDDVADAAKYAERFGAQRIIHRNEASSQPGAEVILEGNEPQELAPGFVAIPTPGHTLGHCVLLVQDRYLFTGDHLHFDRDGKKLEAYRDYCWHSWPKQTASMRRLLDCRFEWVLPGHGQSVHLPEDEMHRQLAELTERMSA
ncbi:MAG: MBL fold metallo-hydrolase [Gemmataceae bacterium]|nr:MBL fold metallo-hydrolase [Gemmataceae bacterium]